MGDLSIYIYRSKNETNFINLLRSYGYFPLITLPTSTTPTSATIIDHVLTNDIQHNTNPMILQTVITDHYQ